MYRSLVVLPILLVFTAAELTCYYPDATVATDHIPCNSTASDTSDDASACCFGYGSDYCLANGLCWFDGVLSRGSCTDKSWTSPSCPQWCREEQRNTSMNMFPCHQERIWQCEWHDECTNNVTLQPSGFNVVIRDDQQPNASNAILFANPNAKFVAATAHNASTSSTTSSVPTGASSATTSKPDASSTLSAGAKAGIAVGAVIGFLALVALLCFLFVRRRGSRLADGQMATGHMCEHCGHAKSELTGQPVRVEMDGAEVKPELTAQTQRWEMDDGRGRGR